MLTSLLAGAVLLVAGCAGPSDEQAGEPANGGSPTASTPTPSASRPAGGSPSASQGPVPEALQFSAPLVGGGQFDGASLAGRPAVLWFWAAWCPRCRAKAADVADLAAAVAGRAQVVGVAGLGSGDEAIRDFVTAQDVGGFPHLADDAGAVWRRFGVSEQEYFVLIDASGEVVHHGPLSADELRRRVSALAG
jgi:peroxiredoxin